MKIEDLLHELNRRAKFYIKYHTDDWTKNEQPRVANCHSDDIFIVGFHEAGSVTLFISGTYCQYTNWENFWGKLGAFENIEYFYYDGNQVKHVSMDFAVQQAKCVFERFPIEYIKDCNKRLEKRWKSLAAEPKELSLDEWISRGRLAK